MSMNSSPRAPLLATRRVRIPFPVGTTSYTPSKAVVEIYGFLNGGGEGGATAISNASGRGGNAGGYTEGPVEFTPDEALVITVGAGGLPGAPGSTSSIGSQMSATGGTSAGPGTGTGGLVNRTGGPGGAAAGPRNSNGGPGGGGGGAPGTRAGPGKTGGAGAPSSSTAGGGAGGGAGTGADGGAASLQTSGLAGASAILSSPTFTSVADAVDPLMAFAPASLATSAPRNANGWGGQSADQSGTGAGVKGQDGGNFAGGSGGTGAGTSATSNVGGAGGAGGIGAGGGGGGCSQGNGGTPLGGAGGPGQVFLDVLMRVGGTP